MHTHAHTRQDDKYKDQATQLICALVHILGAMVYRSFGRVRKKKHEMRIILHS